jgi:hypothetical protein
MSLANEIVDKLIRVNTVSFNDREVYIEVVFPNWKAPGEGYSCGIYTTEDSLDKEKILTMARECLTNAIQNDSVKWRQGQMLCHKLIMTLRRILSPIELRDPSIIELLQEVEKW